MKTMIISDSLALKRQETPKHLTYPELLKKNHDIELIAERRYTTRDALKIIEKQKPENLILHLGICDCAPRLLSIKQREKLNKKHKLIRWLIIKFLHYLRQPIMKIRKQKVWIPIQEFEQNLIEIANHINNLIIISIAPTDKKTSKHSPGLQKNIKAYNQIIKKFPNVLNISEIIEPEKHLIDGIHLNTKAHKLLADKLDKKILQNLSRILCAV